MGNAGHGEVNLQRGRNQMQANVSRKALRALLFWASVGIGYARGGSYSWVKDEIPDIGNANGMKVRKPHWKDEPHRCKTRK